MSKIRHTPFEGQGYQVVEYMAHNWSFRELVDLQSV